MKKEKLPQDFRPYKKLVVCSNELFDGAQLMRLGDDFPLIIGQNEKAQPLLWLSAVADQHATSVIEIIYASVSVHPLLRVDRKARELTAFIGPKKIIHISSSGNEAKVNFLDLRLIGFEIFGDKKTLKVSGSEMKNNKFFGTEAMLDLMPTKAVVI